MRSDAGAYIVSPFGARNYKDIAFGYVRAAGVPWGNTWRQYNHGSSDFKTTYQTQTTILQCKSNGATLTITQQHRTKYFTEILTTVQVYNPSSGVWAVDGACSSGGTRTPISPTVQNVATSNPTFYNGTQSLTDGWSLQNAIDLAVAAVESTQSYFPLTQSFGHFLGRSYNWQETGGFRSGIWGWSTGSYAVSFDASTQTIGSTKSGFLYSVIGANRNGNDPSNYYYTVFALKSAAMVVNSVAGELDMRHYCESEYTNTGDTSFSGTFSPHQNCMMTSQSIPLRIYSRSVELPVSVSVDLVDSIYSCSFDYAVHLLVFPTYPTGGLTNIAGTILNLPPTASCCDWT